MPDIEQKLDEWLQSQLAEANARRRELLEKGLGHGTMVFLRTVWYPAVLAALSASARRLDFPAHRLSFDSG